MNGVLDMTEILLETDLSPFQIDTASTIRTSGRTLLNLLNDILDFSKIEAGKLELAVEAFPLNECIEDTIDLFSAPVANKGIELNAYILDGAPESVIGDPLRLQQILVNLVDNAVKFTENGAVTLRVAREVSEPEDLEYEESKVRDKRSEVQVGGSTDVAGEAEGNGTTVLKFEIEDSGIGIPADFQDRIFEDFRQADSTTTKNYGGSGLGLAISKRLIDLMGGKVGFVSKEGVGTTFTFTVPFGNVDRAITEGATRADSVLAGRTVLLVDDSPTNRTLIGYYLRRWKMKVFEAGDGHQALQFLGEGITVNAVIFDFAMPDMDGLDLASRIGELVLSPDPLKILCSSIDQVSSDVDREKLGIDAVVNKPIKVSFLQNALISGLNAKTSEAREAIGKGKQTSIKERDEDRDWTDLKVLLVEDNEINQKVALTHLSRLKVSAGLAVNGLEAVEMAAKKDYDFIFMDVQMPVMDGLEATRRIRSRAVQGQRPVIVGLTAIAMSGDSEKCIQAGMDHHITKPFRSMDLAKVLRSGANEAESGSPHISPG